MRTSFLKILAFIVAFALIIGVCLFANSLLGNPISESLAKNTAEKYVSDTYKDTDYELEEVTYSFKDGYYHAHVTSKSSVDTHFELLINGFGKLKYDNYDQNVKSGWNTASRLDTEYRNTVKTLFESNTFPYNEHIGYGEIVFVLEEYKDDVQAYALVTEKLTVDAYYNANEFGKNHGKLTVYLDDENPSAERMAEVLLGIRGCFDNAGIGRNSIFACYELIL